MFENLMLSIAAEKRKAKTEHLHASSEAHATVVKVTSGVHAGMGGILRSWVRTDGTVNVLLENGKAAWIEASAVERMDKEGAALPKFSGLNEEAKQVALDAGYVAAVQTPETEEALADVEGKYTDAYGKSLTAQMRVNYEAITLASKEQTDYGKYLLYARVGLAQLGPNQAEVSTPGVTIFFSYNTPVGVLKDGKIFVTDKKWSTTTSRHIKKWLNGREAEVVPQETIDGLAAAVEAPAEVKAAVEEVVAPEVAKDLMAAVDKAKTEIEAAPTAQEILEERKKERESARPKPLAPPADLKKKAEEIKEKAKPKKTPVTKKGAAPVKPSELKKRPEGFPETKLADLKDLHPDVVDLAASIILLEETRESVEAEILEFSQKVKKEKGYEEKAKKINERTAALEELLEEQGGAGSAGRAVLAAMKDKKMTGYTPTPEEAKKLAELKASYDAAAKALKEAEEAIKKAAEERGDVEYTETRSVTMFPHPGKREGEHAVGKTGPDVREQVKEAAGIKSALDQKALRDILAGMTEDQISDWMQAVHGEAGGDPYEARDLGKEGLIQEILQDAALYEKHLDKLPRAVHAGLLDVLSGAVKKLAELFKGIKEKSEEVVDIFRGTHKVKSRLEAAVKKARGYDIIAGLYDALVDAGVKLDSHESDLYVEDTPKAREIINRAGWADKVIPFKADDGSGNWFEVPFGYKPFWDKKSGKGIPETAAEFLRRPMNPSVEHVRAGSAFYKIGLFDKKSRKGPLATGSSVSEDDEYFVIDKGSGEKVVGPFREGDKGLEKARKALEDLHKKKKDEMFKEKK